MNAAAQADSTIRRCLVPWDTQMAAYKASISASLTQTRLRQGGYFTADAQLAVPCQDAQPSVPRLHSFGAADLYTEGFAQDR